MANSLGIDINEIVKSAYNTVLEIQLAATETVGTDCLWARATPVINSEDIILQEYTLTLIGLECPQKLKAVVSNTDYNPGEYTIDLYGMNYVLPLEINITILEWNNIFGQTTMPLKGDIVYVQIYHKLFEVASSELIYTIAAMPTYYKVILSKYNPIASRKETEEFRESVEELTTSQQDLFGDLISEEVADNNATNETSYNNTTYVDPTKEYDINSIVVKQLLGVNDNLIANAYYDFVNAEKDITYKSDLIYEKSAVRNHLIYSCWCRFENMTLLTNKIRKLVFYTKNNSYWYFRISTPMKLKDGDNITITRGSLLKVNGIVTQLDDCINELGIAIKTPDILKANKKLTKWYETPSVLKIYKTQIIKLFTGYDENNKIVFDIKNHLNTITVQIGNKLKTFDTNIDMSSWNYFMFDISPESIRIVVQQLKLSEYNKVKNILIYDNTVRFETPDFNVSYFMIENMGLSVLMCNIRLYENEYEFGEAYEMDMYSPVTRNSSKLILVDSPNVPNKEPFISPVR